MSAPWGLRIADEAPLTLVALLRGRACLVHDDGSTVRCAAGDVAIVRGPDHYRFADAPDTTPEAIIHPGQRCTTLAGAEIPAMQTFGVRRWGNRADGETEALIGSYAGEGEVSRRLLDALPRVVTLRGAQWQSPLLALLAEEMLHERVGQDAFLDRLLDLVLIDALRAHFASTPPGGAGWQRALGDPVVAQAVRLLQERPAERWTLAALARATCVSRATLARRFAEVVGQPPMDFLTEWRMALAADLILDPSETVASVAARVGYGSPFALSAAFKRVRGVTLQAHRRAERIRVEVA